MSADDFQSKYASVMESMLKSAVAETTKLFETMVDELKAEIAKMKKENEELKARCSQFERTRDQATVYIRESEPPPGRRDASEKRDTAVQCDLIPLRTMLVEQCQPLRLSSLQNQRQQCGYEEVHYALQEHDYESHGEGNSQMAFILVKQESVLKQEEVESTVASRQVLRDKADSPWASPCGIENEGPFINTVCSTRETSLPPIHKETQVAMELPILVTYSGSQGAQNQPCEPEHSLVISLAAVKDDLEEESEVSQKMAEIGKQGELMTPEHLQASVAPQQSQREGEMSVNEQSDVTLQQNTDVQSTQDQLAQPIPLNNGEACDQLKNCLAEVEASSQPGLQIRRRRGRPPKKAKRVQQQVKEILQSSSSDIPTELEMEKSLSSSFITPSNQQRADTSLEDVENSKVGSLAVSVVCSSRRCSSEKEKLSETQQLSMDMEEGTIQAPSTEASSAVETLNTLPAESPQAPQVQSSECYTSVTLQDALLLVEAMNQSLTDNTSSSLQRKAEPAQTQCAPPSSETQAHINVVTPKQNTVSLSSMPPSTAATQTTVQSFQQLHPHSLITSVATTCRGKALPHKIIIVPRPAFSSMSRKIAEQSPNQLPSDKSTVITTQNKSKLQGSTAAGLPMETSSSSSATQKTIHVTTSKLLPVVTKSTSTSQGLYSGTLLPPRISTAILRQVAAAASRNHQAQILTAQQDSAKSAAPVMVSTSQLISSTQQLSVSVDTQTALNDVTTISSQKRDNTSDNLKTLTNLQTKEKLPAVVRLSRLPFPISAKESVFVSRLPTSGSAGSQSILKQGTTHEKSLSFVTSTQPSETLVLSTDNCPNLKETSVAMSVYTTRISEEPIDIEEKISSENCITLEESPTIAISMTDPLAASGTAGEPSSNLEDCELSIDQPTGEKQSAAFVCLTSTKTKDTSDPHSQMSKAQFLAHLAVSPVAQDPKEASSDSVDAEASRAETSISDKKRLQQTTLMAQLRNHIKTHLEAKRTDSNPEPLTETANCTVRPKKLRLENDHLNDKNTTSEPIPLSPKNPGAVADFTSLKTTTTTTDPTPMSRKKYGLCKDGVKPSVSETSASPRSSKPNSEATPVSPRRSGLDRDGVVSTNERSTSVSPRRSSSTKENATPEKTKNSLLARRTSSTRSGASPKNTVTDVSPNTKITSLRSKRTSSSRDGVTAKRTKSTAVNLRISGLSKNCSTPKMSTSESTSFCRRRCTFAKDDSSTKQIKAESSPCSPRSCSATADGASTKNTKNESDSPSVRWPKLSKDGNSPRKTRESTSIKKSRLIQDGATLKKNLRVVNAKKLANAAKAKTIAKMKNSNESKLQSGAKTSQLAENRASCKAVKRCTAKAVWTPPRLQASKTPPAGGKRSVNSSVKKEMVSPKSQGNIHVYPHSVSLHPIPIKAPPVVSPLQPLSVIGRRLLKNQCGECGRVLSSSAALESHVSLHTGRRPFSCTLCGKRFVDSKGLKRHGRVHRNGRIHVCQQCGKGFVYRFGLTKHLQMVHSRIKPFVCQICNKGCFTKLDVEAHIRIHTGEKPFHCNLCEKKFTRRVDLNVHLRWHNGEKRHWCPYCGKGFLDFNNMKRHKYIHTGEKPHACPHCPKHFTQSGHLKKHVKNVHKIQ